MATRPDEGWRQHVLNNVLPRMEASNAATTSFEPAPISETVTPWTLPGIPHGGPNFDPIDRLADIPASAEKYRLVARRSDNLHAVIPEFERIREASMAKIAAANDLRRLTDHPQDGGFGLPETDARVVAATKRLEKETANFNRLQDRQRDTTAAWQAASAPKVGCDDLLRHGVPGGCTLEPAIEVEPTLLKGESIIDAVERFRRRGRELRADAHRIRSSPYPSAHAKRKMREQIEQLSQRGEPSVSRLVELDGPAEFQTQNLRSTMVLGEQRALAFAETPDALALIAWLHKDALIKRFDELIDAEADDACALSREAREKAEAEVMGDLLAVEREESFFVWQAQAQGLPIEHRADISPLALLGVALVTTPRAEAPETTQGYSWPRR